MGHPSVCGGAEAVCSNQQSISFSAACSAPALGRCDNVGACTAKKSIQPRSNSNRKPAAEAGGEESYASRSA